MSTLREATKAGSLAYAPASKAQVKAFLDGLDTQRLYTDRDIEARFQEKTGYDGPAWHVWSALRRAGVFIVAWDVEHSYSGETDMILDKPSATYIKGYAVCVPRVEAKDPRKRLADLERGAYVFGSSTIMSDTTFSMWAKEHGITWRFVGKPRKYAVFHKSDLR